MKTSFENENLVLVPENNIDYFMIGRLSALKGGLITLEKDSKEPRAITKALISKKEVLASLFKDVA